LALLLARLGWYCVTPIFWLSAIHLSTTGSALAKGKGGSCAHLVIAWTLCRPELTSAIVGARRPGQVDEIAPASDWTLSEAEIAEIDALLAARAR
jgi:aryl-alcohol dehydrogenase-like predicted oxidoreductase